MEVGSSHFNNRQVHLNAAPQGIDARYAWRFPGGDGSGKVRFIDIERGWMPGHMALKTLSLSCTGYNDSTFHEHGTAVLGIVMMQDLGTGLSGITPGVRGYAVSEFRRPGQLNTARAIAAASAELSKGDVLLLETQTWYHGYAQTLLPIESKRSNFRQIREAVNKGIIVIEAAGNNMPCGFDLDGFRNKRGEYIFSPGSPTFTDSGAILVAAASCTYPYSRRMSSNFGERIDCFAMGENVTTAGSYDKTAGKSVDCYHYDFGGTSSAAAIIAGAAISIQSILEANGQARLTPVEMRAVLRDPHHGTPSFNGSESDKIGHMPDLRKIIGALGVVR